MSELRDQMGAKKPRLVDLSKYALEQFEDPADLGSNPVSLFSECGLEFYTGHVGRMTKQSEVEAQHKVTLEDQQRTGIAVIVAEMKLGALADSPRATFSESGGRKGKGGGTGIKGFAARNGRSPAAIHNAIAHRTIPRLSPKRLRRRSKSTKKSRGVLRWPRFAKPKGKRWPGDPASILVAA